MRRLTNILLAILLFIGMAACDSGESTTSAVSATDASVPVSSSSDTAEASPADSTISSSAAPASSLAEATESSIAATEPRPFTPVQEGVIFIDSNAVYTSRGENLGWQKYIYTFGEGNKGKQHVSYDVTPLGEKLDASVNFADYEVNVRGFENLAILVRMNTYGYFDARNGASMDAINKVYYSADQTFHVDVYADMLHKNYTVYITPRGGEKTLLVENAAFRNSALAYTNDLGKMAIISFGENEKLRVENIKLGTWE
ncbi:MAG: hypothetical protein PHX37_03425 [Eubacteriales bacterium]|nr:hypothetical protein [Eubacteriales bacterium]